MQLPETTRAISTRRIYFAIFCIGALLYGKSLFFNLTHFDDTILLEMNQSFLGNIKNLPKLFTTDIFLSIVNSVTFYRPLLNLLFMLEAQVAPDNLLLYHSTNVLLHIVCCILVFKLFQQMQFSQFLSAFMALIFCVHPLNTSAVVWIPGRNDSLLTCFVLGSFIFFLRAYENKRTADYIKHMLLFFLALLAKESAICLPFLCLGYVYLIRGEKIQRREFIALTAGYGLLAICWLFLRSTVYHGFEIHETSNAIMTMLLTNLPSYFLYIGKVFAPINLSPFPNVSDHSLIPGIICLLIIGGMFLLLRSPSRTKILFGFLWFFLFLAPSLFGEPIFYEHRAYCPLIGLLIAIAYLPPIKDITFTKKTSLIGAGIVLLILALFTFFHEDLYQDRQHFAFSAYASAPSASGSFSCIATLYLDGGYFNAAEKVILAEIKLRPSHGVAYRMLGDVYADRHEYGRAEQEYERSLQRAPLDLITYLHYGKMNIDMNHIDDAVHLWKTAVQINPNFLLGYYYLANCYLHAKNDPDSAWVYVQELQQRGENVLPELVHAIETHPRFGKKR
jgi:protein O-mannosyl-transferase